jgi:hypothetical protein
MYAGAFEHVRATRRMGRSARVKSRIDNPRRAFPNDHVIPFGAMLRGERPSNPTRRDEERHREFPVRCVVVGDEVAADASLYRQSREHRRGTEMP